MAAPATTARVALKEIIEAEFTPLKVRDDRLHGSLGVDGDVAATYPEEEDENDTGETQITVIGVQMFGRWDPEIDPEQTVDPSRVEDWSQRLKRAVHTYHQSHGGSSQVWFFRVIRVTYPPDPTGNITRIHATVHAWGQNAALRETSA